MADRSKDVRKWAVDALGQFDDPAAVDALAAVYRDFIQPDVYDLNADRALGGSGALGRKELLSMLRSPEVALRGFAARGLAVAFRRDDVLWDDLPDEPLMAAPPEPGLIEGLVAASRDEYKWVAVSAIEALGSLRDERVVPALVVALRHDSSVVRESAMKVLCARHDKQAEEPLVAALCEQLTNPQVCEEAAKRLGSDPRATKPLLAALKHENADIRVSAAQALGNRRDPAVIADLAPLPDDPEIWVRRAAAAARARLGDDRGLGILIEWHASGESGNWRIEPLPEFGARAVGPLAKEAEDPARRERVIETLALIKDPQAVDPLMALAADKDSPVRVGAIRALGNISDKRAADCLAALIDDSDVRTAALAALAKQHDSRALAPLLEDLEACDPSRAPWDHWSHLFSALGDLKDPQAVEPILAVLAKYRLWPPAKTEADLTDPTAFGGLMLRAAAAQAICHIGDPRGVPILMEFCYYWIRRCDPGYDYVADLVAPGEAAFEPLVAALADPREEVRWAAAMALVELAKGRAAAPLRPAFDTLTPNSRCCLLDDMAGIKEEIASDFLLNVAATDDDCEVRAEAVKLLPYRGGPEVVPAIRRAAEGDPSCLVRVAARRTLWRLTGEPRPAGVAGRWIERYAGSTHD